MALVPVVPLVARRWRRALAASACAAALFGGGTLAGRLIERPSPARPAPRVVERVVERVVTAPPAVHAPCPEGATVRHGHFAPIMTSAGGSTSLDVVELCADHYAIVVADRGVRVMLVEPAQPPRTVALPLKPPVMVDHYRYQHQVAAAGDGRRIVVAGTLATGDGRDQVAFFSQDGGTSWSQLALGRDLVDLDRVALTATELVWHVGRGDQSRHHRVRL